MNIKRLSPFLAASALALSSAPALGEVGATNEKTFFCQVNEGVPTTVAQKADGDLVPIFHWKNEALPSDQNPQQLCNSVAAKLENYAAAQTDSFISSFRGYDQGGLPAVCASGAKDQCDLILFTLAPSQNASEDAEEVLVSVLDKSLQGQPVVKTERGFQSTAFEVDFFSLLGFGKLFK